MGFVERHAVDDSIRIESAVVDADRSVGPFDPEMELVVLDSAAPSAGGAVVQSRASDEFLAVGRMLPDLENSVKAVALMNVPAPANPILGHSASPPGERRDRRQS